MNIIKNIIEFIKSKFNQQPEKVEPRKLSPEELRINAQALEYIYSTNHLISSYMRRGIPIPEKIVEAREEALKKIVRID